jgi:hypothetical protein
MTRHSRMTPFELLGANDDNDGARRWGVVATDAAIDGALRRLSSVRPALRLFWQREMAAHFASIFDVLETALTQRRNNGIALPSGAPASGNCLWNLDDELARTLLSPYEPARWVNEWFDFRNRSLFSPTTSALTLKYLREQFGLAEVTYSCECGVFLARTVPRWRRDTTIRCPDCGRARSIRKQDMTFIYVPDE